MSQIELNEQVSVVASFQRGVLTPLLFKRNGKIFKVEKVDLKYDYLKGNVRYYSFSLSSSGNSYKITFSSKDLEWCLEEVYSS